MVLWRKQDAIQWDDDDANLLLDKHAELYFYIAISLKRQYVGRHVSPRGQTILILS